MTNLEYSTLYAKMHDPYDQFDQVYMRCLGLRWGINAPVIFGRTATTDGDLGRAAFTTDSLTADLLHVFEEDVGVTQRIYVADLVSLRNPEPLIRLINGHLPSVLSANEPNQPDISTADIPILKRCYLMAFSRVRQMSTGFLFYEQFRWEDNLEVITNIELARWIGESYQVKMAQHPELAAVIEKIQTAGPVDAESSKTSRPNLRLLPFTN